MIIRLYSHIKNDTITCLDRQNHINVLITGDDGSNSAFCCLPAVTASWVGGLKALDSGSQLLIKVPYLDSDLNIFRYFMLYINYSHIATIARIDIGQMRKNNNNVPASLYNQLRVALKVSY